MSLTNSSVPKMPETMVDLEDGMTNMQVATHRASNHSRNNSRVWPLEPQTQAHTRRRARLIPMTSMLHTAVIRTMYCCGNSRMRNKDSKVQPRLANRRLLDNSRQRDCVAVI